MKSNRNTQQPMKGVTGGSRRGPEPVPESTVWVVVTHKTLKGVTHKTLKREGDTG